MKASPETHEDGSVLSEVPEVTRQGKWDGIDTMSCPCIFASLSITPGTNPTHLQVDIKSGHP